MYDLVIIGAGPAGQTAALYATRAGLKVVMIERSAPGGKVFLTHKVENYPGFESVGGRELAAHFQKHALKFGAEYAYGDVIEIKEDKTVVTNMGEYPTGAILIATGTKNRTLGVKGEEEFLGKGVSYCAICDGNFFKGKDVVVIGGGNSALEEASYLADICPSVTIVHRREDFTAQSYIVEKLKEKENIFFELNKQSVEIIGDDKVTGIIVEDVVTKEQKTIPTEGVFIYVGLEAQTKQFAKNIILDPQGNIIVDDFMKTSVEGIYAAGDCTQKHLRQITTAVSDGSIAAQSIINYLQKK